MYEGGIEIVSTEYNNNIIAISPAFTPSIRPSGIV